jgi:hypothetical protein
MRLVPEIEMGDGVVQMCGEIKQKKFKQVTVGVQHQENIEHDTRACNFDDLDYILFQNSTILH